MTAATPTFSQIKAHVASIRQKETRTRVIGIRAAGRWTGGTERRDGTHLYVIRQCDSPLAVMMALREPIEEDATKVLITPLEETDLGNDILLRLAKRRLFQIDSWQIIRTLFQTRAVDPRLTGQAWIADLLLDRVPADGYPAARGGFLDAETVWPILLRQEIGLLAESPDLSSLVKWGLNTESTSRFRGASEIFRRGATEWLVEQVGHVAAVILRCVTELERPDIVPLGLACGVVFHPGAAGRLERAAGKVEERYLAGKTVDASILERWSSAATEVTRALRHTDPRAYRQVLNRVDEILREVQADAYAYLSDASLIGFDQRLARFGQRLGDLLADQLWDQRDELKAARQLVRDHDHAAQEGRRLERVDMAHRLVRWLGERKRVGAAQPLSLSEAASLHERDGGFVDWARHSLRTGDPVRELSAAYARLFEEVTKIRERQSQHFASLLADWTAAGSPAQEVVPVERMLAEIVAPLAAESPVLVIVIDGMSAAVCRELLSDVTRHDWVSLGEPGRAFNRPGIAAIPSVTEFSRTSLLSGRLRQGASSDETAAFAEHPALVSQSRNGFPPILFHKATLTGAEDAVLASDVRKEIASSHRKIVGVVVNAVDDNLLKGEQIDTPWSRDAIKVLPSLLYEARNARRLVVLLSDHGHILDYQTQARTGDGGERWRFATGNPCADELLVQGNRALVEGHRLIAPWSERVRYGMKKNGYHGGLTPQEMVTPITVLASTEGYPRGWHELADDRPSWWDEPAPVLESAGPPTPSLKPARPQDKGLLFDLEPPAEQETAIKASEPVLDWVQCLISSPVFHEQKRLAGRGVPADSLFIELLSALDRQGGKMTSAALARMMRFPTLRLPGLLAKIQRILNIDGYPVLSRDDASDTVELSRDLLLKQFDLV
jgi:hypothetical protein